MEDKNQENKAKELQRQKRLERNLAWKDKNPMVWALYGAVQTIALAAILIALLSFVLTPHPQHVELVGHCNSFSYNSMPVLSNCTVNVNATVWESQEQIVAGKTGLP